MTASRSEDFNKLIELYANWNPNMIKNELQLIHAMLDVMPRQTDNVQAWICSRKIFWLETVLLTKMSLPSTNYIE